jgi:hypothetical protein
MPEKNHLANEVFPKIEIAEDEWKFIEALCKIQCTGEEIAFALGISYDTLQRRVVETHGISFAEYYKRESAGGRASLRRAQWNKAMEGNPTMLIWLGKQYLGQKDQQEVHTSEPIRLLYSIDEPQKLTDKS